MNFDYTDYDIKVLGLQDVQLVYEFTKKALNIGDDPLSQMEEWASNWRKESLEHYLSQGWSMGLWDKKGLFKGYFLSQPILFVQGMTQTLYVERVLGLGELDTHILTDTLYRLSRTKHMQRLLFSEKDVPSYSSHEKSQNLGNWKQVLTAKVQM